MNHPGSMGVTDIAASHNCFRRRGWLNLTQFSLLRALRGTPRMGTGAKILASQVGGHAGVSTSEDGSLLIKPALPREVDFYQHLTSNPAFACLRPHIPKFYGTLRLEGEVEDGNLETLREAPGPRDGKDKYF
jgi:hypothetical protein